MYDPDYGTFDLDTDKPLVLLLGNIAHEGVLSMLQSSHRQYKQKLLKSKTENWKNIIEYFDEFSVTSVLIKLSPDVISRLASEKYKEVSSPLLKRISEKQNMVFVYEDLLSESFSAIKGDWGEYYNQPTKEELSMVLDQLETLELNLMPYKTNAQVTVLAEAFLRDIEKNLLFRLYVPSDRMWSNEMDKLIQLFRDYLSKVGHVSARLDQNRTDNGIIYELHGEEPNDEGDLKTNFSEFTQFLDLCATDQQAAENILVNKHVEKSEIEEILSRYGKEAKRLHVDLKHERERKLLNIQQRLESELVDVTVGDHDWLVIRSMVESVVPSSIGSSKILDFQPSSVIGRVCEAQKNVTINLKPQIFETVNGIVTQEINGDQHLGVHGQDLLELISKYGKTKELASAVYEIEDESAPKSDRLNAKQKLKNFLLTVSRKGTDVAVGVLQSYIENKLGL